MIGLVTRYRKHDATLAALAVARHLDAVARSYSINCYDWRVGSVDPAFDNKAHRHLYRQWLPTINHLIWTAPVDNYFIEAASKLGIRSTLYTSWDQLEPVDEQVIGSYAHVLVPSLVQAMHLRDRFKLRNVAVLPYDSGLPHTNKSNYKRSDGRIRLFLSLHGAQLNRVDLSAILVLADITRDFPNIEVTIACSKGLAMYTTQEMKKLQKSYGDRWRVLLDCHWNEQVVEMGKHDLTIWPARWDGFGLIGTTSLAVGTPVLAWDAAPINEHLSSGRNAILVSCDVDYNWLGVPHVKPDYGEFDRILRWLLDRPDAIAELQKHTAERLEERRDDFHKGWEAILPAAM